MTVIVTLEYHDAKASKVENQQVVTYDRVKCLGVSADTMYLTIQAEGGDFSFDPKTWRSFLVKH